MIAFLKKKQASEVAEEAQRNWESVTIENSDAIVVIGDSHMDGYFSLRDKSAISLLSSLETVSKRPGGAVNLRGELLTSGIGTTETEEMAKPIIDDELWTLIEPLLPPPKPRREKNPGRLPVSNRAALTGILFVLKTGLRWRDLPDRKSVV